MASGTLTEDFDVESGQSLFVSIRWTGLGTGLWDWTVGLDCGTGLKESCANRFE